MKKHQLKITFLFIFFISIIGCKRDNITTPENKLESAGRLKFSTNDEFRSFMEILNQKSETQLDETVSKYANRENFNSFYKLQKVISQRKTSILNLEEVNDTSEPFEDLVPDPYFASVLDSNLELSVEGIIYKVTSFGTFIVQTEKYDRLLLLLSNYKYSKNINFKSHIFFSQEIDKDFYKIEDGIILLDTYRRVESKENDVISSLIYNVKRDNITTSDTGTDDWIYQNLPTIHFGAKTLAGKLFESLRGREEIYTENFESKRRVRVNFYNASWGVYSAVGASVKMQKKNWIGWSETAANELRLGWDGLEYYLGQLPNNNGALPHPTYQRFTPVDLPKLTKQYVEVDLLGYPFTFDKNKQLQVGVKEVYDFAKSSVPFLYPKTGNVNYAFKVWSDFTKKSISFVQERDEIIAYNAESLSKVFDWAVGAKITSDFTSINVGYAPLDFTLERASVFGVAKYGNSWRGARIVAQ
ncbi:hypothetical protein PBAC_12470 [Pedobacter glucosidilyticus]|nr:hypothetical protein [Pedobacter glucosidilyticus]KHJ38457.1 hypothetical protein PBAC_12470 [Pedobacter glucosidilyticus]